MSDQHVSDLLELYALGALEPAEMLEVERHLEACAVCREALDEQRWLVEQLGWAAEQHAPPPEVWAKLRRRIESLQRADRIEEPVPAGRSWSGRLLGRGSRLFPGLVMAGLLAIAMLAGWNLQLQRSLSQLSAQVSAQRQAQTELLASGARVITMEAQPAAPAARGNLVLNPQGKDAYLVASGLPRLPGDKAYQLWLAEGDARTSAAVFRPDGRGSASLFVRAPKPLSSYTGCGITIEPASGSPRPTGERVLRATGWKYVGGD